MAIAVFPSRPFFQTWDPVFSMVKSGLKKSSQKSPYIENSISSIYLSYIFHISPCFMAKSPVKNRPFFMVSSPTTSVVPGSGPRHPTTSPHGPGSLKLRCLHVKNTMGKMANFLWAIDHRAY